MDKAPASAPMPPPLAFAIAVALLALVVLSSYSIVAIRDVYRELDRVLRNRVPVVFLTNDLIEQDMALGIALRNATIFTDRQRSAAELDGAERLAATIAEKIGELQRRVEPADEREILVRLAASRDELAVVQRQMIAAIRSGAIGEAKEILTTTLTEARTRYVRDVRALIDEQVLHMDGAAGDARTSTDHANAAVVAATVLAFVGSALFMVALVRVRRAESAAAAQRIALLESQKAVLVREVHHRIKNHLQGLLGLVQEYAAAHPEIGLLSLTLQGQIQSLAAVHGLCARDGADQAGLRPLLETQADLLRRSFDGAAIDFSSAAACPEVALRQSDAVPVALIVSELLVNALKHGGQATLAAGCDGDAVCVTIGNRTTAVAGFDFAANAGLGTGLTLVRSLLPDAGAAIVQRQEAGMLTMTLRLYYPVIETDRHGPDTVR